MSDELDNDALMSVARLEEIKNGTYDSAARPIIIELVEEMETLRNIIHIYQITT